MTLRLGNGAESWRDLQICYGMAIAERDIADEVARIPTLEAA